MKTKNMLLGGLACLTLTGCMSIGGDPKPDSSQVYVLGASELIATQNQSFMPQHVVGILRLTVPSYVDRPQVVALKQGNSITQQEFQRWGEPVRDSVQRVMLRQLTMRLPQDLVIVAPWSPDMHTDFYMNVRIDDLMILPNNSVILRATCEYWDGSDDSLIGVKVYADQLPLHNNEEVSAINLMQRMVANLGDALAYDLYLLESGNRAFLCVQQTQPMQPIMTPETQSMGMCMNQFPQPVMPFSRPQAPGMMGNSMPSQMPMPQNQNYGAYNFPSPTPNFYAVPMMRGPQQSAPMAPQMQSYGINPGMNQPTMSPVMQPERQTAVATAPMGSLPPQQLPQEQGMQSIQVNNSPLMMQNQSQNLPARSPQSMMPSPSQMRPAPMPQNRSNGNGNFDSAANRNGIGAQTVLLMPTEDVYVIVENLSTREMLLSRRLRAGERIPVSMNGRLKITPANKNALVIQTPDGSVLELKNYPESSFILE